VPLSFLSPSCGLSSPDAIHAQSLCDSDSPAPDKVRQAHRSRLGTGVVSKGRSGQSQPAALCFADRPRLTPCWFSSFRYDMLQRDPAGSSTTNYGPARPGTHSDDAFDSSKGMGWATMFSCYFV